PARAPLSPSTPLFRSRVSVRTSHAHHPDVVRWLGAPAAATDEGETVLVEYDVTHRAALHDRLHELGERVELVGPEEVRAAYLAEDRKSTRLNSSHVKI